MQAAAPAHHADARLLAKLERAFASYAGDDGGIDAEALRRALGLHSPLLARRVLAAFDRDGDGRVGRDEFLDGVRALVFGTDREKLAFAFRVHDTDDDGALDRNDVFRMIALSLAESEVVGRAAEAPERLAQALFRAADTDGDGRISLDELEARVRAHPALLAKMTRSEAQWIVPNEELLAWLDAPATRGRSWARLLENRALLAAWLALWIAAHVAIVAATLAAGLRAPHRTDPALLAGLALGRCVTLDGALILLPVLRRALGRLRATRLGRLVPIDDALALHRVVGHTLFALSLAHGAAYALAWAGGHRGQPATDLVAHTPHGATGLALGAVFAVMWWFARAAVRRGSRFELFHATHLLYAAWFALAFAHVPRFALFAGLPLAAFALELAARGRRRSLPATVLSAEALRSGVTRLELERPPGFRHDAGDYVFLCVPGVARHEWHPFTLSSAPERPTLTVHVRSLGNWTAALRSHVEQRHLAGVTEPMLAHLDGPYGSPTAHIFESRFAVFIGAGIGVTPFASVLESLVLRAASGRPAALEKAHFFWLNRDQYSFEWFRELLAELEAADRGALLDLHLCMTAGRAGATALGLELARAELHDAGRSDVVTGLRTQTHMGPPDWEPLLAAIVAEHAPAPVDVFFCGPPGLGAKLRPLCARLGMPFHWERF